MEATEGFTIRLVSSKKEFESVVINAMAKESWRSLPDGECYFGCDQTVAVFMGELNGKPIGRILLTKYSDEYGFIGAFLVDEEYRGQGYGRKIFDAAVASMEAPCTLGLAALPHLEEIYNNSGFRKQQTGARYDLDIPTAVKILRQMPQNSLFDIKSIDEVDLEALLLYDRSVFGFPRRAFLSKWLRLKGGHTRVAVSNEGSIVGYTIIWPTYIKEEGYRVGPLFADSHSIAKMLLKTVLEEVVKDEEAVPVVCIDAPTESAKELAEELQGKLCFGLVLMLTKANFNACFDKWFAMASAEIG